MKFKVYVWCEDSRMDGYDCCGGAFDEINQQEFETKEEAEEAAEKFIDHVGPWEYEIYETKQKGLG